MPYCQTSKYKSAFNITLTLAKFGNACISLFSVGRGSSFVGMAAGVCLFVRPWVLGSAVFPYYLCKRMDTKLITWCLNGILSDCENFNGLLIGIIKGPESGGAVDLNTLLNAAQLFTAHVQELANLARP